LYVDALKWYKQIFDRRQVSPLKGKKWLLIFAVAAAVVLSACTKERVPEKGSESPAENKPEAVEKPSYPFPLTGLLSEEKPSHRAIAVMINNHPKARPQSGLQKADVVIEALAEGGITRFLAIFQSEFPERIGPVRSARDYYIRLAKGFDGLFVFHGWSPEAKKLIESQYIDSLNGLFYDGTLFQRVAFRKAPHNSYISYKSILKGAEKAGCDLDTPPAPYRFLSGGETVEGEDVRSVAVSYSTDDFLVRYEYDPAAEKYKRYSGGAQTVDYDTGDPVLLDNVLIVEMDHASLNDGSGRIAIDLESGGRGYLLQKGKMRKIRWENVNGRIVPYDGTEQARLVPGKTWINIVPAPMENVLSVPAQ